MSKIVIIPGSFNPVTNAHVEIALTAKKAVDADKAIFIPAHDTYVAKKKTLIPGSCRVALINSIPICVQNNVCASNIEIISPFPPKTYNTLKQLECIDKDKGIQNEYYICLGMDNIIDLPNWYNWKNLIKEHKFIACTRNGQGLDDTLSKAGITKYKNHFVEIKIPENNISSTLVRNLCEKGEYQKVKELVPQNVYEYLVQFYNVMKKGD